MNTIIENALKLSKEDKIALYYQLQEELGFVDNNLSTEQWNEITVREQAIQNGTMKMIPRNEFSDFLKQRRNAIHAK